MSLTPAISAENQQLKFFSFFFDDYVSLIYICETDESSGYNHEYKFARSNTAMSEPVYGE